MEQFSRGNRRGGGDRGGGGIGGGGQQHYPPQLYMQQQQQGYKQDFGFLDAASSGVLDSSAGTGTAMSNSGFRSRFSSSGDSQVYDEYNPLFLGHTGSQPQVGYADELSNALGAVHLRGSEAGSDAALERSGTYEQDEDYGSQSYQNINSNSQAAAVAAAQKEAKKGQGYRQLWQQVTQVSKGQQLNHTPLCGMTVEDLHRTIRGLAPSESSVEAIGHGLQYLDSSAAAALLKELHKTGLGHRAIEIFDWLRSLPSTSDLYNLCDVKTYTTAISQCTSHQQLRRALDLVAEMKSRGIYCNVHTYSALMNVCNKCNELDLALDVFRQITKEGIQPSLVTYNTLIEVHGKRNQWDQAVKVLDLLEEAGIQPEVRTYNQVISVCNRAGHPDDALAVYQRMVKAGVQPSATTYTSLISAYGKQGQLKKALEIFQDMVARGCERNVITYSSLISACERVGDYEIALTLFKEMHKEGCTPNVVTFNSLISACANAGQWQKACAAFDQMLSCQCRPDKITFVAILRALRTGGQWHRALRTHALMAQQGVKADASVYNLLLDILWGSGVASAQLRALQLWVQGVQQSAFRIAKHSKKELGKIEYQVIAVTPGAAVVNVLQWLADVGTKIGTDPSLLKMQLLLVLSPQRSKHSSSGSESYGQLKVQETVKDMLSAFGCPAVVNQGQSGIQVFCSAANLYQWMMTEGFSNCIALVVESRIRGAMDEEALAEDAALEKKCNEAFQLVLDYEAQHPMNRQIVSGDMLILRSQMVQLALNYAKTLNFGKEVGHDGVQLADRVLCSGFSASVDLLPLFMCCCVIITGFKGQNINTLQVQVAAATGYDEDTLNKMQRDIRHILNEDVSAVSPARVAQVFFERLGLPIGGNQGKQHPGTVLHGESLIKGVDNLLDNIVSDPVFLGANPSKVAACVTHAVRAYLGYMPVWPTALADMTGYQNLQESSETRDVLAQVNQRLKTTTAQMAQNAQNSASQSSIHLSQSSLHGSMQNSVAPQNYSVVNAGQRQKNLTTR